VEATPLTAISPERWGIRPQLAQEKVSTMKARSVCQPWAWAIVHGVKMVENRWRRTNFRGPLVIHASRSRRYLEEDFADLLPVE
jgi:hypothetical protein